MVTERKTVYVIAGPTASGKTKLAVDLSKHLKTEIISADSRQFYKEIAIGTAKPSKEEQSGVVHHFIDSHSVHSPISAGEFEKLAKPVLKEVLDKYNSAVVVGGSGLFIQALIEGTHQFPKSEEIQLKYNELLDEKGIQYLQELLKEKDFDTFEDIDINNPRRLTRALEIIELTGEKLSSLKAKKENNNDFEVKYFILDLPREKLYERINQRVEIMLKEGLLKEVESVYKHRSLKSLNTVGYKELFEFLDDKIDFEEAVRLIKRNTRRYAKRQLTWFRRIDDAIWIQPPFLVEKIVEE